MVKDRMKYGQRTKEHCRTEATKCNPEPNDHFEEKQNAKKNYRQLDGELLQFIAFIFSSSVSNN